ncbi:MAG: hypothetical protein LBS79_02375 [Tannerella sp.]|jgi:hypothetical protein|nr:hypothetical protein [Tannerella sp.]
MKNENLSLTINPFKKTAGFPALCWGIAGLIIATILSIITGYHYHGLLHYGPASNPAWWCFAAEHLIVWLVPAILFYVGGLILSKSRIRIIDVFGTTLFAQIPFVFMNLFALLPAVQTVLKTDYNTPPQQLLTQPGFVLGSMLTSVSVIFLIITLIWMFQALRVSGNLKSWRLVTLYIVAVFGGDVLCRIIIKTLYP